MDRMLRLDLVRRLAWRLVDLGIMRERIEETFKRQMVVRTPDAGEAEEIVLVSEAALEPQTLPDAGSAGRLI
jgi:hypothetical protein